MASRSWEDAVLAFVGDEFHLGDELCGIVISTKYMEDMLAFWNKSAHNKDIILHIREVIKKLLGITSNALLEYKVHDEALHNLFAKYQSYMPNPNQQQPQPYVHTPQNRSYNYPRGSPDRGPSGDSLQPVPLTRSTTLPNPTYSPSFGSNIRLPSPVLSGSGPGRPSFGSRSTSQSQSLGRAKFYGGPTSRPPQQHYPSQGGPQKTIGRGFVTSPISVPSKPQWHGWGKPSTPVASSPSKIEQPLDEDEEKYGKWEVQTSSRSNR